MAKGIVLCYDDIDPGATANELIVYAKVRITGTAVEIPDRVVNVERVPIPLNVTNLAGFANNIEDALIAAAAALSPAVTLNRTDCLFPTYQRGA
jgi:hypothetical protein